MIFFFTFSFKELILKVCFTHKLRQNIVIIRYKNKFFKQIPQAPWTFLSRKEWLSHLWYIQAFVWRKDRIHWGDLQPLQPDRGGNEKGERLKHTTEHATGWTRDWLNMWQAEHVTGWTRDWLNSEHVTNETRDWLNTWLAEHVTGWTRYWLNTRLCEHVIGWTRDCVNNDCVNMWLAEHVTA